MRLHWRQTGHGFLLRDGRAPADLGFQAIRPRGQVVQGVMKRMTLSRQTVAPSLPREKGAKMGGVVPGPVLRRVPGSAAAGASPSASPRVTPAGATPSQMSCFLGKQGRGQGDSSDGPPTGMISIPGTERPALNTPHYGLLRRCSATTRNTTRTRASSTPSHPTVREIGHPDPFPCYSLG